MNPIGVMLNNLEPDRLRAFAVAKAEGFQIVHTNAVRESLLTGPDREKYIAAARESGLTIHTMFVGFDGQSYADRDAVARTVGLLAVPELREHRVKIAHLYSDLARDFGTPSLGMHLGFIPRDSSSAEYQFLLRAVGSILAKCADNGQTLHLETGQEPAWDLVQFVMEVGHPALGVNFDGGNFILYDTDIPLYALKLLAPFLRGVHCKDALPPTEPGKLGKEAPLGEGQVGMADLVAELKEVGYTGPLILERENGPDVKSDVRRGQDILQGLLQS